MFCLLRYLVVSSDFYDHEAMDLHVKRYFLFSDVNQQSEYSYNHYLLMLSSKRLMNNHDTQESIALSDILVSFNH